MCFKNRAGSVRGVKELVRKRVNLFSSDTIALYGKKDKNNENHYRYRNDVLKKAIDETTAAQTTDNKIVIYTTSLGFVRKTKSDCLLVKRILRCLMLKTEERDVLDRHVRVEYDRRFKGMTPPQVLVNDAHIGGARELESLLESGEIFELIRGIDKVSYFEDPCRNCAGFGYINCPVCHGSARLTRRMGSTRQLSHLRCSQCEEGLIKCVECIYTVK